MGSLACEDSQEEFCLCIRWNVINSIYPSRTISASTGIRLGSKYSETEYISTIDIISLNVFEEVGSVIFGCTVI